MNLIFGSASGIGNELYGKYKKNNKRVFGIDKIPSTTTDFIFDLSSLDNVNQLIEAVNQFELESITFCASNQNNDDAITNIFNTNVLTFMEFLNSVNDKLNNCVICAISSVHSISTNSKNLIYSSSKAALEAAMRGYAINKSNNSYYSIRLGATDTKKLRENVSDIDLLNSLLPSGKIFNKEDVSNFIFSLNSEFKNLMNGAVLQIDNGVLSMLKTD